MTSRVTHRVDLVERFPVFLGRADAGRSLYSALEEARPDAQVRDFFVLDELC